MATPNVQQRRWCRVPGLLWWGSLVAATWFVVGGWCGRADADVVELTNGSRVRGTWVNADEKPLTRYVIRLAGGAEVVLSKDQVQKVNRQPAALASYRKALAKLPDTAKAHWEMAERCGKAKLDAQQEYHLRRVLELDPDHEGARRGLGYTKIAGRWILPVEHFTRLGYVRHKGRWRLPQEVELEASKERAEQEASEWRSKVKRWRSSLLRGRASDQQAALAGFRQIRSPLAAEAIARWLADSKEPKQLKQLYIETLGNMLPAPAAAAALAERIMEDPDREIVEQSIGELKKHQPPTYTHLFLRHLKSKENRAINRAAFALGELGDPSAIPALINALVTQHRKTVGSGGGINAGFGNSGNAGLAAGGGAKIVQFPVKNKGVHTALTMLTEGAGNFGYDKEAWKRWYARTRLPSRYDLRRDQ